MQPQANNPLGKPPIKPGSPVAVIVRPSDGGTFTRLGQLAYYCYDKVDGQTVRSGAMVVFNRIFAGPYPLADIAIFDATEAKNSQTVAAGEFSEIPREICE